MTNNTFQIDRALANVNASANVTLSGTLTLTLDTYNDNILKLDPDGAHRTVLLWPESATKGMSVLIVNAADAAENLVVKDDSNTTTHATINQNEAGLFRCNGTAWSLVCIFTIALS